MLTLICSDLVQLTKKRTVVFRQKQFTTLQIDRSIQPSTQFIQINTVHLLRSFVLHTHTHKTGAIIHPIFRTPKGRKTKEYTKAKKKQITIHKQIHDRLFFSTTIKGNKCFLMTEITQKI